MTIDELRTRVAAELEAAAGPGERREVIVRHVAELLRVSPGDVGMFTYDAARQQLVLCWPAGLRIAGNIPIDSHALVAVTARERRPCVENDFSSFDHPQYYEHALPGGKIRKIVSVPVVRGEELLGVLQVSRKGSDRSAAGPDFTPDDTAALETMAALLAATAAKGL